MASIKAFKALRPDSEHVKDVAELPYDVVSATEAAKIAEGNPYSFFHITRPEIDLPEGTDPYSNTVYTKGKEALQDFVSKKILSQDQKPCLYLYSQVMNGRMQTGLVSCVSIDDYLENRIKKHEFTRKDKEQDRTTHLDILNANTGPVFLIFRQTEEKKALLNRAMGIAPVYDFIAEDSIRHIVRIIQDDDLIKSLESTFEKDILYIADGHHRAASAVSVGKNRREKGASAGEHECFLAVLFPNDELNILPYNRAVRDLNGMDEKSFFDALAQDFHVQASDTSSPAQVHVINMYCEGKWYSLSPKFEPSADPIESLDVSILQNHILAPLLNINDPRTDNRIDFIGGIRGTDELEKLVNSGTHKIAFSMYPTTVDQLISVSDAGGIMPPKSTWFEPKLRSGLFVHLLD